MYNKIVSLIIDYKELSPIFGNNNTFISSAVCGDVQIEDTNIIDGSVLLSVNIEGLQNILNVGHINTRKLWQLSQAKAKITSALYKDHLSKELLPFSKNQRVVVGSGTTIENCIILGDTIIGDNVQLKNCIIINGKIENNVVLEDATVESSSVGEGSLIRSAYVKGEIGKDVTIERATLQNVKVDDGAIIKISFVDGYHVGKKVRISEHSSLIDGPGCDSFTGYIFPDSVINNCDLKAVSFISRNERQMSKILMDRSNLKGAKVVGGSTINAYNNSSSGGLHDLSFEHKRLLEFIARFSANKIPDWMFRFRSAEEIEASLLKELLGYSMTPTDITESVNHPGLFSIEEVSKEYDSVIKDLNSYISRLAERIQDPKEKDEFKSYVQALMELRLRSIYVGLPLIDSLSIQETKGVIHKMYRMFAPNKVKDDRHHLEKVDGNLGKAVEKFYYDNRLSVADRIALAVGANGFDLSTPNIGRFMSMLNIDDPQVLIDLFVYGRVKADKARNFAGFEKISDFLIKEGQDYYTAGKAFAESIPKITLSSEEKDIWTTFEVFSRNKVSSLRERLGPKVTELAEKLRTTNRIVFFFDNLGEMRFDFELLRAVIGDRKQSNVPLQITLVGRSEKVENDVDTNYLKEKANDLMAYAPDHVSVAVADSHSSALLGHDKRFFDPSLMQNLKGSLIIAKGLGNMLTMHNIPHPIYFLLTLKGFMGQRLAEVIGTTEQHVVFEKPTTSAFRDKYRDKFGISNSKVDLKVTVSGD